MRVAVVGGGVIGLCVAHALRRRGAEVTVLDGGRCGDSASAGNAGWVTPGLSAPVPAPGVVRQALRWMLDPESPFLLRPRADPALLAWALGFWRSSRPAAHRAGLRATLELARPTPELFDRLRDDGVDFEMHADGLLFLVLDAAALEAWKRSYAELEALGYDGRVTVMGPREARDREPALTGEVAGALHAAVERHVRPETLTAGLIAHLRAGGAEIHEHRPVTGMRTLGDGWVLETPAGALDADRVVVAAGVWTRALLDGLGPRLPLEAAKGYSVTLPAGAVREPLYLTEIKVGVSPFDDALRLAGTLELAGIDSSLDRRRVDAIVRGARRYLRLPERTAGVEWAGLRPLAADGLPIVGAVPGHPGLFVATGHHMLGVTLAPATGEALAPLVVEDELVDALRPLGPGRFARR